MVLYEVLTGNQNSVLDHGVKYYYHNQPITKPKQNFKKTNDLPIYTITFLSKLTL